MVLKIPPTTERDDDGWADYTEPIVLTPEEAADMSPGDANPAAAVVGFYAALMRGDDDVDGHVLCPDDDIIASKLEMLRSWTIHRLEVRSIRPRGTRRATVRVAIEIEIDGTHDAGTDEVKLQRKGEVGPWRIERPPT
ncbi:hypothetical protein [Mycobacterium spongiae]|uniref:Uncharacterized protein n=1 Tax=Mycobacterium spongiae TaxID=886343 RepID=A0A975PYG7_9MYCO|nr:hypothetical protein [Mycobacterium spongiae]QUR69296.1 hypothetical protein F6B93_21485 [Mycobacterium spongiae]